MQHKCLLAVIMTFIFLALFGCSSPKSEAQTSNTESKKSGTETEIHDFLKPPSLTVLAGEERILAVPGGYSWSRTLADGIIESVEADADSPCDTVKKNRAKEINQDTKIELDFDIPPTSYVIRICNEDNTIASSSADLNFDNQAGHVSYEVQGTWEEGTAIYAFPLFIKE
ncbi:hypothetical protein [Planococcus shixiaomingii]|uniref:hypothetical protein n=1 Tax=Planococcus shixiaomingii TaxID=3058393 RepID=UPI0026323605|nr:hypothetical protein [Planococcus sp. N022]WKA55622.1 hypothetical protein QWY21_04325 [Planococcus sp. N022]